MRRIFLICRDPAGGAGVKFVMTIALVATPLLYPSKTLAVLHQAQSGWEQLWTIDGLSGGRA